MNITTHCRERYVERIQGVNNISTIKQISKDSLEDIEQKITNVFNGSELIFEGSLSKGQPRRKFFVSDNVILVSDIDESNLLTLYKVDFGFPESTNEKVLKDLRSNIDLLNQKINVQNSENEYDLFQKEADIEKIESDIESMEKQIQLLKSRKTSLNQEVGIKKQEVEVDVTERDKICKIVCNSLDYKKDILNGLR